MTGWGKRPDLTPAHHVDLLTGMGPIGARIDTSRTNPVWGRVGCSDTMRLHSFAKDGDVSGAVRVVAERTLAKPISVCV